MIIKECIDVVDNLKPNQYSIEDKVSWLTFLDMTIINEVLKTHEGYDGRYDDFTGYSPDNLTVGLIVPSPYDRVYTAYLKMKIDEENGETARYNNSVTLYNSYLTEYKKWYHANHLPLSPSDSRGIPKNKAASLDVSEAQLEQLRKLLYAELHDDVLGELSDDKINAIVKNFMDTNAQMLKGKDGVNGKDGRDGRDGRDGVNGSHGIGIQKISVTNEGELEVTLTSGVAMNCGIVKGEKGDKGDRGMEGAKGDKGDRGEKGEKGNQGERGYRGEQGIQGEKGMDGKSAFEYAQDGGFTGTEAEFMQLLSTVSEERIKTVMNRILEELGSPSKIGEVTLLASAWVGNASPYAQVVNITGVTENSQVDLTPSVEQLAIFHDKDLAFVTENEDGVVTVFAIGQKPQNDYTMQVTITEVDYE